MSNHIGVVTLLNKTGGLGVQKVFIFRDRAALDTAIETYQTTLQATKLQIEYGTVDAPLVFNKLWVPEVPIPELPKAPAVEV